MAWGTTGGQEHKCPYCGSEWWGPYTSWYYDPHEGKVTSESDKPRRPEHHERDCPKFEGRTFEDVV